MVEYIVRQNADKHAKNGLGRGSIAPFAKYTKRQAGAMVDIGGKKYKVTTDGRLNIPKKIMEKYGVMGDDGRNRIVIDFSTKPSTKKSIHWKSVATFISEPHHQSKNLQTKDKPVYDIDDFEYFASAGDNELLPESDEDYILS